MNCLDRLHQTKKRGLVPCSLYLNRIVSKVSLSCDVLPACFQNVNMEGFLVPLWWMFWENVISTWYHISSFVRVFTLSESGRVPHDNRKKKSPLSFLIKLHHFCKFGLTYFNLRFMIAKCCTAAGSFFILVLFRVPVSVSILSKNRLRFDF